MVMQITAKNTKPLDFSGFAIFSSPEPKAPGELIV